MKHVKLLLLGALLLGNSTFAALSIKMDEPQLTGSKAVIKLTMVNTYSNTVESARAAVFLKNDQGKVVGQKVEWVIGGTKDRPPLAPQGTAIYYVTVPADKPFQKADVVVTRIILKGGEIIDVGKGFQLEK